MHSGRTPMQMAVQSFLVARLNEFDLSTGDRTLCHILTLSTGAATVK
jgi:hypothetical protein